MVVQVCRRRKLIQSLSLSLSLSLSISLSLSPFFSLHLSLRLGASGTKEELEGLAFRIDSAVQDLMLVELMAQGRSKAAAWASVQRAMQDSKEQVSWEVGVMASNLAELLKSAAGASDRKLDEIQHQIAKQWKMDIAEVLPLSPTPSVYCAVSLLSMVHSLRG